MPSKHSRAYRGGGKPDGLQKQMPDARSGGGRGAGVINDVSVSQGAVEGEGAAEVGASPGTTFNAQEATEWHVRRHQEVMAQYESQKGSGKRGDIQNFSDLNAERGGAWGSGRPVIPPKDDFLLQLQQALMTLRVPPP